MAQDQKDIAAREGLAKFKQLLLVQPQRDKPAIDTTNLTLGPSVPVAVVSLDKLKQYKAGEAAEGLISDIDEVIFPVLDGRSKAVTSTLTIGRVKDRWMVTRFGADKDALQEAAATISQQNRAYKLVKIQAFHLSFLSYSEAGNMLFIPLQDDQEKEIVRGRAASAGAILEKYVKPANDYNGLPM